PVAPADLLGLRPCLVFAQYPDDLFLVESAAFHCPSPFQSTDSTSKLLGVRGAGHPLLLERGAYRPDHLDIARGTLRLWQAAPVPATFRIADEYQAVVPVDSGPVKRQG